MKAKTISIITIILVSSILILVNHVTAQCYGCNSPTSNSAGFQEVRQKIMQEQINTLEEQHTQDLHIVNLLIALSVGLGSGIIVFAVIFVKNRKIDSK